MYTARHMNQEKMQNVLLGVLLVGLVLVGGGMYLFSTQLQSVATSVKGIQTSVAQLQVVKSVVTAPAVAVSSQKKIATLNSCKTAGEAYVGLCFDYPSGWILQAYQDEFQPENKDLKITSSPGYLFGNKNSGGPSIGGLTTFNKGYEINIGPITLGEPSNLLGEKVPGYPGLYKLKKEDCDATTQATDGCPMLYYYRSGDFGSIWD